MKIVVIADQRLKKELLSQAGETGDKVEWQTMIPGYTDAGCIIDLLYTRDKERIGLLSRCGAPVVIINEVAQTLAGLPDHFARINGWPLFLQRAVVEATGPEAIQPVVEEVMKVFQKQTEWVTDTPGLVSARITGMIINEAFFALEEGVSTKEEIDTAMKLGTNYPYGPFAWFQQTGGRRFADLLTELAKTNPRYQPAALLIQDALTG